MSSRQRERVFIVRLALLTVGVSLAACSWLVDGEPMPLRCSQEGKIGEPACDPGTICRSGRCEPLLTGGRGSGDVPGGAGTTQGGAGGAADAGHGGAE